MICSRVLIELEVRSNASSTLDAARKGKRKTNKQMRTLTGTENFTASVAAGSELGIVAVSTVDLIGFRAKLLVDQRDATHLAQEASFMPMFVFVAQVLSSRSKSISTQISASFQPHSPWNRFQRSNCTPRKCWRTRFRST
jgi:hypothetical protein